MAALARFLCFQGFLVPIREWFVFLSHSKRAASHAFSWRFETAPAGQRFYGLPERFFRVLCIGEGAGQGIQAAVIAEVVPVKDDLRPVGILEPLFRFKGAA